MNIKSFKKLFWLRTKKPAGWFAGPYMTWEQAAQKSHGYADPRILEKVLQGALQVKQGSGVFERDSVVFHAHGFDWPVLAVLAAAAAACSGRLHVLDFGGSLGSGFFQNLPFLKTFPETTWAIVEQPHFVKVGKKNFENKKMRFFRTIQEGAAWKTPNVILLSAVLQYLKNPYGCLRKIWKLNAPWVVLDKVIVQKTDLDEIYVQRVPQSIYPGSYPCRSFSEKKLLQKIPASYRMLASFESIPFPAMQEIEAKFRGYILKKE